MQIVEYQLGPSLKTAIVWTEHPVTVKDIMDFEAIVIFTEDEVPIEVACPLITRFKVIEQCTTQTR